MHNNFSSEPCSCPDTNNVGKCIMKSSIGYPPAVDLSSCSVAEATYGFNSLDLDRCLYNVPTTYVMPPVCGNGFLEEGELCDCGTIEVILYACSPTLYHRIELETENLSLH